MDPILFIENTGQNDSDARFQVQGENGAIHLAQDSLWITLLEPDYIPEHDAAGNSSPLTEADESNIAEPFRRGVNVRLQFNSANSDAIMEGFKSLDPSVSYFSGQDPSQWHVNVPVWGGARYVDLYPGIDLEILGSQGNWSWRLILKDPLQYIESESYNQIGIRLQVDGAEAVIVDGNQLRIQTTVGEIVLPMMQAVLSDGTPLALPLPQMAGSELIVLAPMADLPQPIQTPEDQIMPENTTSQTINGVNDLVFSTHLGGEDGRSIAVDASGGIYVAGWAWPVDFPTTPGAFQETGRGSYEAFVLKLNSTGSSLLYATYLSGSYEDEARDIAVGNSGIAYITGRTLGADGNPSDFPVTIGACGSSDAFVTALSPVGNALIYSRCLGGSGGKQGFSIALNQAEEAYTVGQTSSVNFPVTSGAYDSSLGGDWDGYIVKIGLDGSLLYASYLGGDSSDCEIGLNNKECTIDVDNNENLYIAGSTYSTNFPTTPGAYDTTYNGGQDGFVMKFSADGSELLFSTYFGGSGDECFQTCTIAVDNLGATYVVGSQTLTPGGDWNAFYASVYTDGSSIHLYPLGGSNVDIGSDIAVDSTGAVYVIGETSSIDFPFTAEAYQAYLRGPRDAFIVKLNPDGGVYYSTFLGGDGDEIGYGITIDQTGIPYITGWTGFSNFPTTPGAFRPNGGHDAFAAKLYLILYTEIHNPSTLLCCSPKGGGGDGRECPIVTYCGTQGEVGDPINTRTGSFDYSVSDLSVPTSAGLLVFQHSYSSLATDI